MAPATLPRDLTEQVRQDGSGLAVDEAAGVIKGVKVLGRFSPNCHGVQGVTEGTEYTPAAMKDALTLYDGVKVYFDHPTNRTSPGTAPRSVRESFGVIRAPRMGEDGASIRGDLHYPPRHPFAAAVVDDVKGGLGLYGLSHNASAGRTKVAGGRFVVEQITAVRSVDLVDDAATNKNLWESRTVTTTFKKILEARLPKLSAARQKIGRKLLEDGELPAAAMDAPVEEPADPDAAMIEGFLAAIGEVFKDKSMDLAAKKKKIIDILTAHDKLTAEPEPTDTPAEPTDSPADTSESLRRDLNALRAKDECRTLCESMDFVPTADQLADLIAVPAANRKRIAEAFKGTAKPAGNKPKSSGPGKPVTESKTELAEPANAKDFAALIRG